MNKKEAEERAQARIDFLIKKTIELPEKGIDCILPKDDPKRYECLNCKVLGKNEFCRYATQLCMENL